MTTLPFRQRALEPGPAQRPAGPTAQAAQAAPTAPTAPAGIHLVAPDAVPPGAVVLGVVIARPADHQQLRPLVAVHTPDSDPGIDAGDGVTHPRPGLVVERWGRRVLHDGVEVALTRREFELLEYLSRHPDRVFTRTQLLAAVWDITDPRYAPDRTVDVHVSRLRRKLGPAHADALQSLRGVGYRWSSRAKLAGRRS